jgi:hypothetical protein
MVGLLLLAALVWRIGTPPTRTAAEAPIVRRRERQHATLERSAALLERWAAKPLAAEEEARKRREHLRRGGGTMAPTEGLQDLPQSLTSRPPRRTLW